MTLKRPSTLLDSYTEVPLDNLIPFHRYIVQNVKPWQATEARKQFEAEAQKRGRGCRVFPEPMLPNLVLMLTAKIKVRSDRRVGRPSSELRQQLEALDVGGSFEPDHEGKQETAIRNLTSRAGEQWGRTFKVNRLKPSGYRITRTA